MKQRTPGIYMYRRIVQAKLFMDEHYGEKMDLNKISGEAYFSKYHFMRLFRELYGIPPHQYLTGVRIRHARRLLQEGRSVSESCFEVGFESISTFSGKFKQVTGIAPSAYREQQRKRQEQIRKAPLQFIPHCFALQKGWVKESNFEEVGL